jgi:hypothetical protein
MINLVKGQTQRIFFTATELATIPTPYFLFVVKCLSTNKVVKFVAQSVTTTDRSDSCDITTNTNFATANEGLHAYTIYQKSAPNDLTESGVILERGYIRIYPASAFNYTEYQNPDNTYTT